MDIPTPSKWMKARAIIAAALSNLIIGSYYNYGNINGPISKYFKLEKELTLIVVPMWLFFQTLATTCSMAIAKKVGSRLQHTLVYTLYALLNLSMYFFKGEKEYGYIFIVLYGAGSGYFIGNAYLIGLYTAWTYFPLNSIPTVTGVILFFTGLGATILGPITQTIVNPKQIIPDTDDLVAENVPKLFLFMGFYFLGLTFLVTLVQVPIRDSIKEIKKMESKKASIGLSNNNSLNSPKKVFNLSKEDPKDNEENTYLRASIDYKKISIIRISEEVEYNYKKE